MQNYHGNAGDYMRRGNQGENSRVKGCQYMGTAPLRMCEENNDPLNGMVTAMAYVPWQTWRNIMSPEKALKRGTIFEELDLPFLGMGACR